MGCGWPPRPGRPGRGGQPHPMPEGDGDWQRPLRSKGLLPAVGVGAAVYFVTGVVSIGTLGLIGVGAGVGYGVGTWIADRYGKKQATGGGDGAASMDQLPWAMQVSLQKWQAFLVHKAAGQQLTPPLVEQLFTEFEQLEPQHAVDVRSLVLSASAGSASAGPAPVVGPGGVTVVPNSARAAEV
mmetsp:Transcript_46469/g.125340  ORF Transcript_46469/g.125340 Transcript_46469/m.125340 type:complete len:183 (-) Transcript_46469:121-669(-)